MSAAILVPREKMLHLVDEAETHLKQQLKDAQNGFSVSFFDEPRVEEKFNKREIRRLNILREMIALHDGPLFPINAERLEGLVDWAQLGRA